MCQMKIRILLSEKWERINERNGGTNEATNKQTRPITIRPDGGNNNTIMKQPRTANYTLINKHHNDEEEEKEEKMKAW